ncbi:Small G protein signaling modulator 1, partial [Fragariocoptes setiger]
MQSTVIKSNSKLTPKQVTIGVELTEKLTLSFLVWFLAELDVGHTQDTTTNNKNNNKRPELPDCEFSRRMCYGLVSAVSGTISACERACLHGVIGGIVTQIIIKMPIDCEATPATGTCNNVNNNSNNNNNKSTRTSISSTSSDATNDECEQLLGAVKKEVKQIMEEAVTRKFVHEDSSSVIALCVAVDGCLAHRLKRRVLGLFKTNSTTALIQKISKTCPEAEQVLKMVDANARAEMVCQAQSQAQQTLAMMRRGRLAWLKTALIERKLVKIIDHLTAHASNYYEKNALMCDYVCAQILASLLVGPCALDYSKMKTQDHYWTDPSADELVARHKLAASSHLHSNTCARHHTKVHCHHAHHHHHHAHSRVHHSIASSVNASTTPTTPTPPAAAATTTATAQSRPESPVCQRVDTQRKPLALSQSVKLVTSSTSEPLCTCCCAINAHDSNGTAGYCCSNSSNSNGSLPAANDSSSIFGPTASHNGYSFSYVPSLEHANNNNNPYSSTTNGSPTAGACSAPAAMAPTVPAVANCQSNSSMSTSSAWSPRMLHETLHQNARSSLLYAKNNVIMYSDGPHAQPMAGYLSLHQTSNMELVIKWIPNQMINGAPLHTTHATTNANATATASTAAAISTTFVDSEGGSRSGSGSETVGVSERLRSESDSERSQSQSDQSVQSISTEHPECQQRSQTEQSEAKCETNESEQDQTAFEHRAQARSKSKLKSSSSQSCDDDPSNAPITSSSNDNEMNNSRRSHNDNDTNTDTIDSADTTDDDKTETVSKPNDQDCEKKIVSNHSQLHNQQQQQQQVNQQQQQFFAADVVPQNLDFYSNYVVSLYVNRIVYLHCHASDADDTESLVLVERDGTQRPPFKFPRGASMTLFLSCLEMALSQCGGRLEPPLWSAHTSHAHQSIPTACSSVGGAACPLASAPPLIAETAPGAAANSPATAGVARSCSESAACSASAAVSGTSGSVGVGVGGGGGTGGLRSRLPPCFRRADTAGMTQVQRLALAEHEHANGQRATPTDYVFRVITALDLESQQSQASMSSDCTDHTGASSSVSTSSQSWAGALRSWSVSRWTGLGQQNSTTSNSTSTSSGSSMTAAASGTTVGGASGDQKVDEDTVVAAATAAAGDIGDNIGAGAEGESEGDKEDEVEARGNAECLMAGRKQQQQVCPDTRETSRQQPKAADESIQSLCEAMRRQLISRAFYGWLSYCRHIKTIRVHLSGLVNPPLTSYDSDNDNDNNNNDHEHDVKVRALNNKIKSQQQNQSIRVEQVDVNFANGLTHDTWQRVCHNRQLTCQYVYHGGCTDNELRQQVWPYLLGHYEWGDDAVERERKDNDARRRYEGTMHEWRVVEATVRQRDRDALAARQALNDKRSASANATAAAAATTSTTTTKEGDYDSLTSITSSSSTCDMPSDNDSDVNNNNNTTNDSNNNNNNNNKRRLRYESTGSVGSDASLSDQFSCNMHRIDKDVQRCDRNYHYFAHADNLEKLRNIMCTYVWLNLDIGYVQGMCDLAAPLLVIFDAHHESLAYECFARLMRRMVANFPHGGAMDKHFASMRHLLQVLDIELYELMQSNGDYTHFYFCYRWFLLDFKRELTYDDVFRVWETIWAAKYVATEHFVLFFALAIVKMYRDIILENNMDFTDTIKFFNEMAERHDADKILVLAKDLVHQVQQLVAS